MFKKIYAIVFVCIMAFLSLSLASCETSPSLIFFVENKIYHKIYTDGLCEIEFPIKPESKEGAFKGWYYYNENAEYVELAENSFLNKQIIGPVIIYAEFYTEDDKFQVIFRTNFDIEIEPMYFPKGTTAQGFPIIERPGYVFIGWYEDPSLIKKFKYTESRTNNCIVYAKWEIIEYSIRYELDGGSIITEGTKKYTIEDTQNNNIIFPIVEKEGYIFSHWTLNDERIDKIEEGTVKNLVICANWEVAE